MKDAKIAVINKIAVIKEGAERVRLIYRRYMTISLAFLAPALVEAAVGVGSPAGLNRETS
jgi:hypothetical protein